MNREVLEIRAKRELADLRSRISELSDNDWQVRLKAAGELAKFRKSEELATEAVPALMSHLNDQNDYVGRACISALGDIGNDSEVAIPALIEELRNSSSLTESSLERAKLATYAVGKIGLQAQKIVPVLVELLTTDDSEFRKAIAWALGVLGRDALPLVTASLKHSHAKVRSGCVFAIGNIGTMAVSALSDIAACLEDTDAFVRREACRALGNLRAAKEVESYVPNLISATKDSDPEVRFAAQEALRKIGTEEALAVWASDGKASPASDLVKQLSSDDKAMRTDAAEKLVKVITSEDVSLVPLIIRALKDQMPKVRAGVAESLGLIGDGAKEAISGLVNLLGDSDARVRASAAQALGRIGSASQVAIPSMIALLKDSERDVRMQAAMAMEEIGGEEATKALDKFSWN